MFLEFVLLYICTHMAWQFYKMLWYCLNLEIERFGETCLQVKLPLEALPPASKSLQILQPILFATWNDFFFYFQKKKKKSKLSKIWFVSIMKQRLNWSGLNSNEFLQKFAETYGENFLHLPQKTICSLPKHKNSSIGILKIFNS